jgi:hypothetical protein
MSNADITGNALDMTVRMLCDVDTDGLHGLGGSYREGQAYSLPYPIAQLLVTQGYAVVIVEPGPQEVKDA